MHDFCAYSGGQYTIEDGLATSKLALAYKESSQFTEVNEELTSILDQARVGNKIYSQYATSFPWQVRSFAKARHIFITCYFMSQLLILCVITMKSLLRNPMVSVIQVLYYNCCVITMCSCTKYPDNSLLCKHIAVYLMATTES